MRLFLSWQLRALFLSLPLLNACSEPSPTTARDITSTTLVTPITQAANQKVAQRLPINDQTDFEQANRGFIAKPDAMDVVSDKGERIWRISDYDFVQGEAPASVNPSLWRQAKLNNIHGLFKVQEGIYQLRGFDLSNMTLIEGESGWIVVDPLTAKETATFAMVSPCSTWPTNLFPRSCLPTVILTILVVSSA